MPWHARLQLDYRLDAPDAAPRTVLRSRHAGPLRVLASLYPEDATVCHNVLVHPPGGLVGGDVLEIEARLAPGSHALITTPGAARFYRSAGETARQALRAQVGAGACLEWLPLETLVRRGAQAENDLRFELAPGARMLGWDLLALGLPASGEPFDRGRVAQRIELPGLWLERARVDGSDTVLLDSPLGWAGRRVLGCLWAAGAEALAPALRAQLLDLAREQVAAHALAESAGASSPDARLVVLRVLAERTEPAADLLHRVWAAWRQAWWQRPACAPRVWRT